MLIAFSVTPLGAGEAVGEIVAEAVRVVRASGLPNQTDSMFTTIEGDDWDEVMAVVKAAVDAVAARAPRVSLVLKADIRPGVTDGLIAKVETIERYLGRLDYFPISSRKGTGNRSPCCHRGGGGWRRRVRHGSCSSQRYTELWWESRPIVAVCPTKIRYTLLGQR
jgi:uncharacterized protein (TIGR00106 family)